jgi:hypothetical protein
MINRGVDAFFGSLTRRCADAVVPLVLEYEMDRKRMGTDQLAGPTTPFLAVSAPSGTTIVWVSRSTRSGGSGPP